MDTVLASVAKTHRIVVVDEGWRTVGLAAEISARIMEDGFDLLDWPVRRVCRAEVPMPYAKHLEDAALPRRRLHCRRRQGDTRLMAEFVMPALGADMSAGTLIAWQKQPGDTVERGDIIAVVHTDKADVEVEMFTSGVLEKLLVEPGQKVPVGTPFGRHPRRRSCRDGRGAPAAARGSRPAAPPSSLAVGPAACAGSSASTSPRFAGQGPSGRIQRKDVERPRREAEGAAPAPPAAAGSAGADH